jgi:ADP-heptose:LPS heptosyltransferase
MPDKFLKKIELSFKEAINCIIFGSKSPIQFTEKEIINPKDIRKILLLRQDRLGDLLFSSSFIRNLKEINPDFKIDILLSKKNIGGIRSVENHINDFYIYDKKLGGLIKSIKGINNKEYDLIIDLFDNPSTTSSLILKFIKKNQNTNKPIKIGLEKKNRNSYDIVVPKLDKKKYHIVNRMMEILKIFGINPNNLNLDLEYEINDSERMEFLKKHPEFNEKFVGINLSGSSKTRFWGIENNIEFIKLLKRNFEGINVVLFGTKEYINELNAISEASGAIIAPFTDSVHQWVINLSLSSIIVSPDTSAIHFASVWKIPSLIFYESNNNDLPITPINSPFEMLTTKTDSIQTISPEEAFEGLKKLWKN